MNTRSVKMSTVALARNAMATRFEIVLHGESPPALRAAGEEALDEIERLEARLSLYRPGSEIAHLNSRAARQPVRVTPALFALLQEAQKLSAETGGAFDITIGPLVKCWGFMGGSGRQPTDSELAEARQNVGMRLVHLDPRDFTVRFLSPGVMLDLGAIGKGYAIERAAEILREAGVTSAVLHGGTSTIYALGNPPDADSWPIAITHPQDKLEKPASLAEPADAVDLAKKEATGLRVKPLAVVPLKDAALSVSAVWGKYFDNKGEIQGHVLDPRTGRPVSAAVLGAVVLPSATETDALSTALLTVGLEGHNSIARLRPGIRTLVAARIDGQLRLAAQGIE